VDSEVYYTAAVVLSIVASVISVSSFCVARKSLRVAKQTLKTKYHHIVDASFEQGAYDSIDQCYRTKVTIFNVSEVPVKVEAKLLGQLYVGDGTANVDTVVRRATIKGGESQEVNIDLLTGGCKGEAKLNLHCNLTNSTGSRTVLLELGKFDI